MTVSHNVEHVICPTCGYYAEAGHMCGKCRNPVPAQMFTVNCSRCGKAMQSTFPKGSAVFYCSVECAD